jgi:hypothetical protein
MNRPERDQLNSLLLARFPQFRVGYEDLLTWRKDPGTHLVFSSLFTPHVIALLENGAESNAELARAFQFVEELAQSEASGVREVLVESVLDSLVEEPRWVRSAWPFMGEKTRSFVQAIAKASS